MLSIEDRNEILKKYLQREDVRRHEVEKKKKREERLERMNASCGTQSDVRWLITTECNDIRDKVRFLSFLVENNNEWIKLMYIGGYLCPLYVPFRRTPEMIAERKKNVLKRYQTWKRLRPYLRLHGIAENETMYPAYKHTIFHFSCGKYENERFTCNVFVQMILNYIPFYNVFLYDPLEENHTGYRYYSGEPIIVYYLTQKMIDNVTRKKRIREAVVKRKANGYDLRNVWKIVICTGEWEALNDPRGNGDFEIFEADPGCESVCAQCMLYWKDYTEHRPLFDVYNVIKYAISEKILPWPYYKKDGKLELLECVKRPERAYISLD